jgi:site-specific DNA-methyltransferase (adenine-specific)
MDNSLNYRNRYSLDYAQEYMALLNEVWAASIQMLRPGGYLAINVGSVLDNGYHYPLAEDIINELTRNNLAEFVRSIFWHKVTAGVKRAGSVIQHPYPGYWHPNIMTEHIIILRKPGLVCLPNIDVPEEWLEPVWDLAPVPPRKIDHPAPYPEEIPHRLIRMFTKSGEWVLDPFNGAGATSKAAIDLGRSALGFDIEQKYVALSKKRLKDPSSIRDNQLKIVPVHASTFVPGPSRGKTRQGAGLGNKRK